MRKMITISLSLLFIILVFVPASSAKYITTQLTDNSFNDLQPCINNAGQIAWAGWDGNDYEIFLYDGTSIIQLTDNAYDDLHPQINNSGQVVWDGSDGNDTEIFLYDGTSIIQLTDNAYGDNLPQINNSGQVVWQGSDGNDYEIFLYDGTSIIQLTDNAYDDLKPQINNSGQVVWQGSDGSDWQIFLYDGTQVIQLTNSTYGSIRPQINDSGQVVWYGPGANNSSYQIFLYNGSNTIQLTDNTNTNEQCQINNSGNVVWLGWNGNHGNIFLYNGTTTIQLTDDIFPYLQPQISNSGHVVWMGRDGNDSEIFLYDGTSIIQLTDNAYDDTLPLINDSGQVVWVGGSDANAEIFLGAPANSTLSIFKTGAGTGTVTSMPPGINCGTDCSQGYQEGIVVTLTVAADIDSTFAGWSGAGCSGTGVCVATMNADITVTATFTLTPELSLKEGTIGSILTITGSGFGDKKGKVLIGGFKQKIDNWTPAFISVTVNKVPLPAEIADDVLIQPKGTLEIPLFGAFTVKYPEIDSLDFYDGAVGDPITITGNFFSTKKGKVYLEVPGGKPKSCKVTSWGMDSITFAVPKTSKSFPAGIYPLKVTNKVGTTYAPSNFTVK